MKETFPLANTIYFPLRTIKNGRLRAEGKQTSTFSILNSYATDTCNW